MSLMDVLATRSLNEDNYSTHESKILRTISISSCSSSIVACLIMYYTYMAIHPSRRKFRHQLIFFLVTFDFLKAISMIVFPVLTYLDPQNVGQKTINFLGFFTAFSIEGSDLAILSFAVHTFFTIFYPHRTGGLYFIRNYVYVGSVLIPMILAGLAFINKSNAYQPLTVFCYLPISPVVYRIALSWGPRYFIMLSILIIYCTIYFYVINQLKNMETSHEETPKRSFKNLFKKKSAVSDSTTKRTETTINLELQMENSQRLKTRYKVIARQIKIIFLYPISYFILWIFPLMQQSLQLEKKDNYVISMIVAFMTPWNGTVDTIVFLYREKPWQLTYSNTPRSPFLQQEKISRWRRIVAFLPLYSLPEVQDKTTMVDTMEAKMLTQNTNALMASINPDEFVHTPTTSSFEENTQVSSSAMDSKRKLSTVSSLEEDEDEMDFMDFLNKGPPA